MPGAGPEEERGMMVLSSAQKHLQKQIEVSIMVGGA